MTAAGQVGLPPTPSPWPGAPRAPRRWQAEALDAVITQLAEGKKTIVSAVMGAGKSVLIAELAARRLEAGDQTVLVTTPTMALVDQLAGTLRERLGDGAVGRYFTHAKEPGRPVVVACNASAVTVSEAVAGIGRSVDTWIADEVHKTETSQILEAHRVVKPARAVGLTATPYRSEGKERLSLWESVAYRYSLGDALRDGVLVPWRVVSWNGKGRDEIDEVCWSLISGAEGPGMINASDIPDAEALAERLSAKGMAAGVVHSRRSRAENAEAIERLKAGDLRVMVHVNMLAEGVDFPWLRWLCLRRPVGAKVRFIQEVGRVLRSSPGKTEAVLYDPHDLFGSFGWHYAEAIGEWKEEEKKKAADAEERAQDEARRAVEAEEREEDERERKKKAASSTDPITSWCRRLLLPLQAEGMASADRVSSSAWRMAKPSEQQLSYLQLLAARDAWRRLPDPHCELVDRAITTEGLLTRGGASDLISIAKVRSRKAYPPVEVEPPPEEAFSVVGGGNDDPAWYAAAAYRKVSPEVAFVIVHGGRVVYQGVRPRTREENWISVQCSIAKYARKLAFDAGEEWPDVVLDSEAAARYAGCRAVTDDLNPARQMAWWVLSTALKGAKRG